MFRRVGPDTWECWPVPVIQTIVAGTDEINSRIVEEVRVRAQSEPSAQGSNAEAWQSPSNFFETKNPDRQFIADQVRDLMESMNKIVGIDADGFRVILEGWCVRNKAGQHHHHHIHHSSVWSGVYYPHVPTTPAGRLDGAIEFIDPRFGAPVTSKSVMTIAPQPGLLILFPSWLEHWVHPHFESDDRVSVPFNIYMMPEILA